MLNAFSYFQAVQLFSFCGEKQGQLLVNYQVPHGLAFMWFSTFYCSAIIILGECFLNYNQTLISFFILSSHMRAIWWKIMMVLTKYPWRKWNYFVLFWKSILHMTLIRNLYSFTDAWKYFQALSEIQKVKIFNKS